MSTAFAPIIPEENKAAWEDYAESHQYGVAEGTHLRKAHPEHKDPLDGSFQDHEERRQEEELETPRIPSKIQDLPIRRWRTSPRNYFQSRIFYTCLVSCSHSWGRSLTGELQSDVGSDGSECVRSDGCNERNASLTSIRRGLYVRPRLRPSREAVQVEPSRIHHDACSRLL